MHFSFRNLFHLDETSVAEIVVYDDNNKPLTAENVLANKIAIPGEQAGIFNYDMPLSTSYLPGESTMN